MEHTKINVGVFSPLKKDNPCTFLRLIGPLSYHPDCLGVCFADKNYFESSEYVKQIIEASNILVLQRDFPAPENYIALQQILRSGKPVVYELDDMIWELPDDHHQKKKFDKKKPLLIQCLNVCEAVTVSTALLAESVSTYNRNVHVLPNLICKTIWSNTEKKQHDRIIIGFAGTKTHVHDLNLIEDVLIDISKKYKNRVEFKLLGCMTDKLSKIENVQFSKFDANYASYANKMSASGIDIALAPLQDTLFNRCKSNIKWLEYSTINAAGVYSNLPPYNTDILNGKTGMLATTPEEWYDALCYLIENKEKRVEMAQAAAAFVSAHYSMEVASNKLLTFYNGIYDKYHSVTLPDKKLTVSPLTKAGFVLRKNIKSLLKGYPL